MVDYIRQQLLDMAEEKYRVFSSSLTPGKDNILGVRIPLLRKLAKNILKEDWRAFLDNATDSYMEEVLLQGLVICGCDVTPTEKLRLVECFVPKIDCWPVCDSFCIHLKLADTHKEMVWEFIQPYLRSDKEYDIRFGVVMLLHYISPEYVHLALEHFDRIKHEGYYARMAVAWLISAYYTAFPEITLAYLKDSKLDSFTYNKAIQKIRESLKVDKATKDMLRAMKR
jgi:3-methyladenine DNA glycosylase AlkD